MEVLHEDVRATPFTTTLQCIHLAKVILTHKETPPSAATKAGLDDRGEAKSSKKDLKASGYRPQGSAQLFHTHSQGPEM